MRDDLKDLQRALLMYRLCYWLVIIPFRRSLFSTQFGLCYHFSNRPLPKTLHEIRPAEYYKRGSGYWFEPGELFPRIELLKKAIEKQKELKN